MSDEPITADELHRHIQASMFGRPYEKAERYDQLAAKLHELVDAYTAEAFVARFNLDQMKLTAIRAFVERVEKRAGKSNVARMEWVWKKALWDELAAMEEEANEHTKTTL